MKKLKRGLLILAIAGPSVANFSCSSVLLRDMQEAAVGALSTFVGTATLDLLGNLNLGE